MGLADLLTMTDIAVIRITQTEDGMGGFTSTTSTTILPRGTIYREGSASRLSGDFMFVSDKRTKISSHILVCEPSSYTFTNDDTNVTQGSDRFEIVDTKYDVMGYGELLMLGLRLIT